MKATKQLSRADVRGSGYFYVVLSLICLAVTPDSPGWIRLSLVAYGILGLTTIADAERPGFHKRHPWLLRFIVVGMVGPAVVFSLRDIATGSILSWSLETLVVGLIMPIICISLFAWYVRTHGVDVDEPPPPASDNPPSDATHCL